MKQYTYAQALELSTKYFGNDYSAAVYIDKYALRDNDGNILEPTPDLLHDRLAREFARIDKEKYDLNYDTRFAIYRDAIDKFARIVPQGSVMSAVGNPYQIMSASNCVVIASPKDSMNGIFESARDLAQLSKRRCGVGTDLSTLRPEGAPVNNAAKTTSGAWSFADFYSFVTRMVGQKGRRAALMLTLDVHHPDVVQFATSKHDKTKVTGANISVRLSNKFLQAVEDNTEYEQYWPMEGTPKVSKFVRARDVWNVIVNSATKTADPGLIMWDTMVDNLPANYYPNFKSRSTNPCAEISLSEFDSCRLISINLTGYVKNAFEDDAKFDFNMFKTDITIAMQMADNLVDLELELIAKIQKSCNEQSEKDLWEKLSNAGKQGRRTGLGTHGLADTLAQLKIKYDTEDAVDIVSKIYKTLRDIAYDMSCELAKVRGAFPVFDYELEKECPFIKKLPATIKEKLAKTGRRNISLLTQAPTGTVSSVSKVGQFNLFNVSSGIEPVFRNIYVRRKKINANEQNARIDFTDDVGDKWQEYKIAHSNVQAYLEKNELNIDKAKLPSYFITSDQIDWKKRIELQGEEQQFLDHSISSTINLPMGTSSELVGKIYLSAWKAGLKGITVYVEGSKSGVLLSGDKNTNRPESIIPVLAAKRSDELHCDIKKAKISGEAWTIFVGLLNDKPYEVFGGLSKYVDIPNKYKCGKIVKNGKVAGISTYNLVVGDGEDQMTVKDIANVFDNANYGAFTRTLSLALRHGVEPQYVVEQLQKDKESDITSFSKVMARVLKSYIKDGTKSSDKRCPECGKEDSLVYQGGCVGCLSCPYGKC